MHQCRSGSYEAFAHTVEGLDIVLVDCLRRHKTPEGPCHRFPKACSVPHVVFVRRDRGFDTRRRHALHLVAMCAEAPCPVMRAATGFHADEHGGSVAIQGIRSCRDKRLRTTIWPRSSIPTPCKTRFAMLIPSTLIWGFTGLASCGGMVSLVLTSCWLIEAGPHRGRVHFITTNAMQ